MNSPKGHDPRESFLSIDAVSSNWPTLGRAPSQRSVAWHKRGAGGAAAATSAAQLSSVDAGLLASDEAAEQRQIAIDDAVVKNAGFHEQDAARSAQNAATGGAGGAGERNAAAGEPDEPVRMRRSRRQHKYSVAPRLIERNLVADTCSFLCCSPLIYFRYWLRCVRLFYCSPCIIFTANVVRTTHISVLFLFINTSLNSVN